MLIDISSLDKAAILASLYNKAWNQDQDGDYSPKEMTLDEAKGILDFCKVITALGGKPLLVDLTSNLLNTSWYDSYNGLGTGFLAVKAATC